MSKHSAELRTPIVHYVDDTRERVDKVADQLLELYVHNAPVRVVLWTNADRRHLYSKTIAARFVETYDDSTVTPNHESTLMARLRAVHMYGGASVAFRDGVLPTRLPSLARRHPALRCQVMADPKCPRMLTPAFFAAPKEDAYVTRWYDVLKNYRAAARRFRNEWQDHYELARAHPKYVDVLKGDAFDPISSSQVDTVREIVHHLPANQRRYADTYARVTRGREGWCGRCGTHPLHHLIRAYLSGGTHNVCEVRIPEDAKERSDYVFVLNEGGEVDACAVYARAPQGNFVLALLEMMLARLDRAPHRYALCVREALRLHGALERKVYALDSGETVELVGSNIG